MAASGSAITTMGTSRFLNFPLSACQEEVQDFEKLDKDGNGDRNSDAC